MIDDSQVNWGGGNYGNVGKREDGIVVSSVFALSALYLVT
jgi:hypothetical protein